MKSYEKLIELIISLILFLSYFILPSNLNVIFLLIAYIIVSMDVYKEAFINLKKKEIFDENFLMIIATIGAFIIKSYEEAFMVMFLFEIGEFLADLAVSKSKKSILDLLDLKKEKVTKLNGNKEEVLPIEKIKVGDIFIVKPGERIPLDGEIIEGDSFVDTKALTGEYKPRKVQKKDIVLSGFINHTSIIKVKATSTSTTSTTARIMKLLEEVEEEKSQTETFLTKFCKIYTPVVVFMALFIGIFFSLVTKDYNTWIYRALVFLVTSCPCALVISIPLAYFCGIGNASRNGILIKGSKELDTINEVHYLLLDKTGTITKGNFTVTKVEPINMTKEELLKYAASAEKGSIHVIAQAIKDFNKEKLLPITNFKEISGKGIKCTINKKSILVGNKKLLEEENIDVAEVKEVGSIIHISINNVYAGYIVVSDEIKPSAINIKELKNKFKDIVILSGDNKEVVENVASKLNINTYYGNLLPQDKINYVKKYQENDKVMFVGDGINDAFVMKVADVSVSMGIKGSDASIETSDIVLMNDNLTSLKTTLEIAKDTKRKVIQNIILSLSIKLIVLVAAFLGLSTIWMAVFADVGVTFIAIINVINLLIKKY